MSNSPVITLPEADGNVSELVRVAAATHPGRAALIGAFGSRTWSEVERAVATGAAALRTVTTPGDRLLVRLPAGPEAVVAQFAAVRAGLVVVPLSPEADRAADVAVAADRVGAVGIVGPEPAGDVHVTVEDVQSWWDGAGDDAPALRGGEDLVWLARPTGRPAMLSHRALLHAVRGVLAAPSLRLRPEDRVLQVLPLHHLSGWVTSFLPTAGVGAAAVLPAPAAPGEWTNQVLVAVREHRATVVPAAPGLYRRLSGVQNLERTLASVRLMTSAATPLDPQDVAALRTTLGQSVWEGYGVSEAASVVTTSLMTAAPRHGSVGLPVPGVQVRVLGDDAEDGSDLVAGAAVAVELLESRAHDSEADDDAQDGEEQEGDSEADDDAQDGEEQEGGAEVDAAATELDAEAGSAATDHDAEVLDESAAGAADEGADTAESDDAAAAEEAEAEAVGGEIGRIAVRGSTLFSGYWPDGSDGPDEDGWFVTDDVGYLDDRGELHLVDRAAESFTVAGFTVYPREIEDALTEHPYVRDAAVVSLTTGGVSRIVAVLVAERGTRPTESDLAEHLASRLPVFKRPARYVLVERMPRAEVGRIDRRAVAALVDPTARVAPLVPRRPRGGDESDADLF